jgi:hypothetical protein
LLPSDYQIDSTHTGKHFPRLGAVFLLFAFGESHTSHHDSPKAALASVALFAPWSLALSPLLGLAAAAFFLCFGWTRLRQALVVLRYRRNIRRLPRY